MVQGLKNFGSGRVLSIKSMSNAIVFAADRIRRTRILLDYILFSYSLTFSMSQNRITRLRLFTRGVTIIRHPITTLSTTAEEFLLSIMM
jgi:hypothetical protein